MISAALCRGAVVLLCVAAVNAADAPPTPPALRVAVGGRFLVGGAAMERQLEDPSLAKFAADQFDVLTPENEFKPAALHPRPGVFDFRTADKIVAFCRAHGLKLVGHTLLWHQQTPDWLFQDAAGRPLPRERALANLDEHITTVVRHFKGQCVGWDVVNEALSDDPAEFLRDTPARRAIGDDYVQKAFEFAHAADPDAELYYNDYSNEQPPKRAKTLKLIAGLKAAGVRIDAVGLQAHCLLAVPEAAAFDASIAAYAAAGVKVMLTELDVDVLPRKTAGADTAVREQGDDPYPGGLPPDVAAAQGRYYADLFAVLLKHPGVVRRVTFWGLHDGTSWLNDWPVRGRTNYALPWDRGRRPKPALTEIVGVLRAK